ncbi:aconitase family protein [Mycobacterium xenopi 4042]|uniref:Aconitase family protein n=1 Tax=Mycobacterium xenopi 4042 TaxID=1299334 RepID=X7YRK2_MYCXE|nr:aconitase family protein [Mycobacterium xenopi 4042]
MFGEGRHLGDAAPTRRQGRVNRIIEYHGPGLASLTAMDRHVIANMGAELGATTTVFPSDQAVRDFMRAEGREDAWVELVADDGAGYDIDESIDLSKIEPLIARPSSPGNVVPVRDVAGEDVAQVVIGSSANPGSAISRSPPRWSRDARRHRTSASTSTRPRGRSWPT